MKYYIVAIILLAGCVEERPIEDALSPDTDIPSADSDADLDSDADEDAGDADVASDSDTSLDGDTEEEADIETVELEPAPPCPGRPGMILIGGICIDQYEASPDPILATVSIPGVMPIVSVTYADMTSYCARANKRSCSREEWRSACEGTRGNLYPYGREYLPRACNDAPSETIVSTLQETGSKSQCEGSYSGLFDMTGNIAEWAGCDADYCYALGGSYEDASANCQTERAYPNTSLPTNTVGFRCCAIPL